MKKLLIICTLTFGLINIAALAGQWVPDNFFDLRDPGVSAGCFNRIAQNAWKQCHDQALEDEKHGADRMHDCFSSEGKNLSPSEFEISFSIGDAESYWYKIQLTNPGTCAFKVSPEY